MSDHTDAKLFACWLLSQYNGTHIYSGAEISENYHSYARFYQRPTLTQNAITRILNYGQGKESGWFAFTRVGSRNAYRITLNDETRKAINIAYKLFDRTKARWNDKENGIEYY